MASFLTTSFLTKTKIKHMKSVKQVAFAALLAMGAFGAVTMVSCSKDDDPVVCPEGYEGDDCKTLMVTKFVGPYDVNESCSITGAVGPYTAEISASSTNNVTILLSNFGDFNATITLSGTVNGTNLTIAEQTVSGYKISGNGTYVANGTGNGGTLTIHYSVSGATDEETCTATWVKK